MAPTPWARSAAGEPLRSIIAGADHADLQRNCMTVTNIAGTTARLYVDFTPVKCEAIRSASVEVYL